MDKKELEIRTKAFAMAVMRFAGTIPKSAVNDVVVKQLVRSGTSIGANYREANRACSHNDFTHKISIAEKEAAEAQYWLEICGEGGLGDETRAADLARECDELLAIFTAIGRSARLNRRATEESAPYDAAMPATES